MTTPADSGAHAAALQHLEACWSDLADDDAESPPAATAGPFVEEQGHDDAGAILRAASLRSELH